MCFLLSVIYMTCWIELSKEILLIMTQLFKNLRIYPDLNRLFTDSDAILNFSPVNFCVKWTLCFVSTSNIMEEFQFSRIFDPRKLCNMSVEVYVFMKALTMKNIPYTFGEWEFYNIGQNPSSNIFMKVPLCTSVPSVFIAPQNLFSSENDMTRLIFTRPRVIFVEIAILKWQ